MVTKLLLEAEQAGKRGLTAAEIMHGIDERWWPGVSVNMILPTVYRSIKRNYWFQKEGDIFTRLRGGRPPDRRRAQGTQLKFGG